MPGSPHSLAGERPWNQQGSFNKLNRNHRSVAVDLKHPEGRQLFLQLVARSAVVIENFAARTMPNLGLTYEQLREANEAIIYVTMPGFGVSGPYSDFVALGPNIEPLSGLTDAMGYSEDMDDARLTSMALPDAIAGMYGAAAVLTALERRERTGKGGMVDLSQHEGAISFIGEYYLGKQLIGRRPQVVGNSHPVIAPHGTYRCRGDDDWIVIVARDDDEWSALAALAGRGWDEDARFSSVEGRREHRAALDSAIEAWTGSWDKVDLTQALQTAGVPAGAVLNAPEMLDDSHLNARGFFVELEQTDVGRVKYPGTAVQIDGARHEGWTAAPTLGQHNAEVLSGLLGLSEAEVSRLHDEGVLVDRPR